MASSGSIQPADASSPRNLVVCLDGTTNEPETGFTNVARMFDVAEKNPGQLVYYDPGVGTMGAPAAITPWSKALTRVAGMVAGYGIRDNIEEAYTWLARQYRSGDRIFVFGFSRGAYTARALTGMLLTVGLLHADAANLMPYALKLYAKSRKMPDPAQPPDANAKQAEEEFWKASSVPKALEATSSNADASSWTPVIGTVCGSSVFSRLSDCSVNSRVASAGVSPSLGSGAALSGTSNISMWSCNDASARAVADRTAACNGRPWYNTVMCTVIGEPSWPDWNLKMAGVLSRVRSVIGRLTSCEACTEPSSLHTSTVNRATGPASEGMFSLGKSAPVRMAPRSSSLGTVIRISSLCSRSGTRTRSHN